MGFRGKWWWIMLGVAVLAMFAAGGLMMVMWAQDLQQRRMAEREEARRRAEEANRAEREADRRDTMVTFTDPVPPSPADTAAFLPLFDGLGKALERQDAQAAMGYFELDRMIDQLNRAGAFDKLGVKVDAGFRAGFKRGATQGLGRALTGNPFLRWTQTTIRRVRWSADRTEAVVVAVHREESEDVPLDLKMRWWFVSAPGGWKIYDLEELDTGFRFSHTVAQILTPEVVADPGRFRDSTQALREAIVAVKNGNADAAEKALAGFTFPNPPPPLAALQAMIEGLIRVDRGQFEEGLRFFDQAARLNPDMPVVHLYQQIALARTERYEESLAEARKYTAVLGPDPVASFWEGYALEGLRRHNEAATAYRRALDDAPDYTDALHGLRRVLPPDHKGELAERLARAKKPTAMFDALLAEARKDGDEAGATALLGWLRKARPDDTRAVLADIRELVRNGKHPEATARLREALKRPADNDREDILTAYLLAMLDTDRSVEAYAAVPPADSLAAFRTLASELEDRLGEGEPGKPDPAAEQLTRLIAAHRKRHPDDPWLWFYEGTVLESAGNYADAQVAFAAGQAKLEERPGAVRDREAFRARRVVCFYRMKQGLQAYAQVWPPADTFRQLAYRYSWDKDTVGLTDLIAAHSKVFPDEPVLVYWRAEVRFIQEDYQAAANGFGAYRKLARENDPERFAALDKQLRSLIRAERPREARSVIVEVGRDKVPVGLRAAVTAAIGDVAGVEQLMAAQARTPNGLFVLYNDPDFARLIAADEFAELRQKYPDPRPKRPGNPGE